MEREVWGHAYWQNLTYLDYFIIPRRIRERMGREGLVILLGNTKGTLQRNVIEPMQDIYGAANISSIRSDNTATIFGERVHCLGADNKKHVDRLRGTSIKYCYGDEVVTWEREVFQMLKSRLDKPYSCFDGTCNPGGPGHWFKEFLESDADIFQQQYKLDDNPFLDPGIAESLKKEHSGVWYQRHILGEWTLAAGRVYPNFDHEQHIFGDDEAPALGEWFMSIDYGIQNPMAALLWCVNGNTAYCMHEYYHDGRKDGQRTDEEHADKIVELAGKRPIRAYIVDPSATSFIVCLRRRGLHVVNARNEVLAGIAATSSALHQKRLMFHKSCVNTIQEFNTYTWDEKADDDRPNKDNDHAMDAVRYFVKTALRKALPTLNRRTIEDD